MSRPRRPSPPAPPGAGPSPARGLTAATVRLLAREDVAALLDAACAEPPAGEPLGPAALVRLRERLVDLLASRPPDVDAEEAPPDAADLARAIAEQRVLRVRGGAKFAAADRMLFTRTLLEQASSERLARYKAGRFAALRDAAAWSTPVEGASRARIWDVCCGLGGDTARLAHASRGARLIAVDRSEAAIALARHNLSVFERSPPATPFSVEFRVADAEELLIDGVGLGEGPTAVDLVHLDPDRRAEGRRTIRGDAFAPPADVVRRWLARTRGGCVKLPPGMTVEETAPLCPPGVPAEWEWVGDDREAKQLLLWTGELATTPGGRSATVLATDLCAETLTLMPGGRVARRLHGPRVSRRTLGDVLGPVAEAGAAEDRDPALAGLIPGSTVYDPHPAVVAAGLVDALATSLGGERLTPGAAYLTGRPASTRLAGRFTVETVTAFDRKGLVRVLRDRGVGLVEVKARGVAVDPDALARALSGRDGPPGTLLIVPDGRRTVAILARRVAGPDAAA